VSYCVGFGGRMEAGVIKVEGVVSVTDVDSVFNSDVAGEGRVGVYKVNRINRTTQDGRKR
jgi:hypothetical protein